MDQGLRLTSIGSATGIGVLVSSRGGSLMGKKTSWMLSKRLAKADFSSKALPRKASSSWPVSADAPEEKEPRPFCEAEVAAVSASGGLSRSFAIVSAGSHFPKYVSGAAGVLFCGSNPHFIMRERLPCCLVSGRISAVLCDPVQNCTMADHLRTGTRYFKFGLTHNRRYARPVVTGFLWLIWIH